MLLPVARFKYGGEILCPRSSDEYVFCPKSMWKVNERRRWCLCICKLENHPQLAERHPPFHRCWFCRAAVATTAAQRHLIGGSRYSPCDAIVSSCQISHPNYATLLSIHGIHVHSSGDSVVWSLDRTAEQPTARIAVSLIFFGSHQT